MKWFKFKKKQAFNKYTLWGNTILMPLNNKKGVTDVLQNSLCTRELTQN